MMFLAKTGRWLGGPPPTGFSCEREEEILVNGKIKKASYLVENEEIKTINLMYKKFLEIGSINGVAKYLTRNGIKTIHQNYYNHNVIKQILRNPVYCAADKNAFAYFKQKGSEVCFEEKNYTGEFGIMPFNRKSELHGANEELKWVISIGKHKGLIKGADWITTQNILSKNKREPYTYTQYALLSGAIECTHCEGSIMFSKLDTRYNKFSEKDRRFGYYCMNKLRYGVKICNSINLVGKKIDYEVVDYLMEYNENDLRKGLDVKRFTRKANKFKDKSEEVHFQIQELKNQQDKYVEHLLTLDKRSPIIKKVEIKVRDLETQIEKLQAKKRVYDTQSEIALDEKTNVEQVIKNLRFFKENFHSLEFDEKKSLLRLLLKKIIWNGSKLDIILNGEQR